MKKHTSYGIGGPAEAYINPYDYEDIIKIIRYSNKIQYQTPLSVQDQIYWFQTRG